MLFPLAARIVTSQCLLACVRLSSSKFNPSPTIRFKRFTRGRSADGSRFPLLGCDRGAASPPLPAPRQFLGHPQPRAVLQELPTPRRAAPARDPDGTAPLGAAEAGLGASGAEALQSRSQPAGGTKEHAAAERGREPRTRTARSRSEGSPAGPSSLLRAGPEQPPPNRAGPGLRQRELRRCGDGGGGEGWPCCWPRSSFSVRCWRCARSAPLMLSPPELRGWQSRPLRPEPASRQRGAARPTTCTPSTTPGTAARASRAATCTGITPWCRTGIPRCRPVTPGAATARPMTSAPASTPRSAPTAPGTPPWWTSTWASSALLPSVSTGTHRSPAPFPQRPGMRSSAPPPRTGRAQHPVTPQQPLPRPTARGHPIADNTEQRLEALPQHRALKALQCHEIVTSLPLHGRRKSLETKHLSNPRLCSCRSAGSVVVPTRPSR